MPKNILIVSDGTGQAGGLTPDENISNIYKLYRATRCGPENNIDLSQQLTFSTIPDWVRNLIADYSLSPAHTAGCEDGSVVRLEADGTRTVVKPPRQVPVPEAAAKWRT